MLLLGRPSRCQKPRKKKESNSVRGRGFLISKIEKVQ